MARNLYTNDEVTLCTYAAMYEASDFGGISAIAALTMRSQSSILLKIRNVVSTLDDQVVVRHNSIKPLTGKPTGDNGRMTNWEVIQPLVALSRQRFLDVCLQIVNRQ